MAAQMTGMEMLVQEIEQLQAKKTSLQATVKAAEAKLRDLREQVVLKEYECRQLLVATQEKCDAERAALSQSVAPLRGEVDGLKGRLALEHGRLTAMQEKHVGVIQSQQTVKTDLDKMIAKRQATLQEMDQAIATMKQKVSAL